MTDHNGNEGVNAAFLLRALRRRWLVVLACMLLVPAAALIVSLAEKSQYTASASLLFRDPGFDQKLFGSTFVTPNTDPAREAATNVKLVSLEVVAERTARALPGAKLTANNISDKVSVSAESQSDVASVEATDPSPRAAALLANTFATEYIAFRRNADRAKVRAAQQLVQHQLDGLPAQELGGPHARGLRERSEQLDILASLQTGNAELVQRGVPPSSPSSPKPVRNAILGLGVGLLLGVGLALLFERIDRRLRDPKEIEAIFERPILGAIPESRALLRDGQMSAILPPGEAEAFRMLRANLRYFNVDRDVRSVLVTSSAPGDGKSTVAWNLAAAAAAAGMRTLLIEADLRHPTLSKGTLAKPFPGLSNVLAGDASLEDVIQAIAVPHRTRDDEVPRTMDIVTAGPLPPNPTDLIESEHMHDLIESATRSYELVVVDTPPTSVVSDAIPLVTQVSGVIVVSRLGKSTRESTRHLRNQLANLDAPTLGVVINGLGGERDGYGYGYGYGAQEENEERGSGGGMLRRGRRRDGKDEEESPAVTGPASHQQGAQPVNGRDGKLTPGAAPVPRPSARLSEPSMIETASRPSANGTPGEETVGRGTAPLRTTSPALRTLVRYVQQRRRTRRQS